MALVKLPSGEVRKFSLDCMATIGQVGNLDHETGETYGKAGRTRWHGRSPTVRGVAMNPVDHPHGGGEGRVKGNHPQDARGFRLWARRRAATGVRIARLWSAGSRDRCGPWFLGAEVKILEPGAAGI